MIYPNIDCYYLCVWMLTISKQRLTGPQTTLTETIRDAALAETGVTETEWNNFNQYAAWRNPYYLVYRDYAKSGSIDLLTGLNNYYDFEGNSNDLHGSLNGTDSNVAYSGSYGKIGQGVRGNAVGSYIALGGVSDFSFIQNTVTFSINFWFRMSVITNIARVIGINPSTAEKGIFLAFTNYAMAQAYILGGTVDVFYQSALYLTRSINDTNFHMVSWVGDGVYVSLYIDGFLLGRSRVYYLPSGNSTAALRLMAPTGTAGSNPFDMDELGIWSRALNYNEIQALYNNGSGLPYSSF